MQIDSAAYTKHGMVQFELADGQRMVVPALDALPSDIAPAIAAWQAAGGQVAAYAAPVYDWAVEDQAALNRVLAEDGSVVRALAEIMFEEINKLRQRAGLAQYTKQQFVTAMRTKMRTT